MTSGGKEVNQSFVTSSRAYCFGVVGFNASATARVISRR